MSGKRRILIFSTAYSPFIGGAEVAIKEITDRLGDQFAFELITARIDGSLPPREQIGNVVVHRIGTGSRFDKLLLPFRGFFYVHRLMRERPIGLFWCMMATYASGAAYLFNLFSRKKVPLVLTLQEGDSEQHIARRHFGLIGFSWRMALARTDLLTVISTYLEERARHYGYAGELAIVPNGVDVSVFARTSSKNLRQKLGFADTDVVLVTVSRLVEKNAVGDVLLALTYLPDRVKLLIIGEGALKNTLENQAQSLGLTNRTHFAGFIGQEKLPDYLHMSDIFIRPSLSEGQGIAFLEAMAAGVPVIATPVGGIPDFLEDGRTGLFCEVKNPKSIARHVERLMKDKKLRDTIIASAQKMVEEKYDWDMLAPRMGQVFERMIK